jgi:hypothetical protein
MKLRIKDLDVNIYIQILYIGQYNILFHHKAFEYELKDWGMNRGKL